MVDVEAIAVDSPLDWVQTHTAQYLQSDGADVEHPQADSLILLYTTGRKSGQIRRIALIAIRDGDDLVVMASKGGAPVHPDWYFNLADDSTVWVRDKANFYEATAVTLDPQERAEAWENLVAVFPFMEELAARTDRVLPLVRLTSKS